jgi:hypothetical protein
MDIDIQDAGQVELICILIANEMARAQGEEVVVGSDCATAIRIAEGARSERFFNILAGWKKWAGVKTKKIDAHPERRKEWDKWGGDEMGIYVADRVAGGLTAPHKTISAREGLIRISAQSKVAIEEEDGTPFIGSVAKRASEYSMKQYFMERDGYRELLGEYEGHWEGANMAGAAGLLKRNGGFEDRVTMLKLAAGKRWDVSRHNKAKCVLCGEEFSDQRHAMICCMALEVHNARGVWKNSIKKLIKKAPTSVRADMEEYMRTVLSGPDGEMAAVGTYTVRWVEGINKGRRFDNKEWRAMKGLMKAVAQGARGVMRVYTRACCDKSRIGGGLARGYIRELELRQLSIG